MKFFIDFLSVALFYVAYKFYVHIPEETVQLINSWLHLGLVPGEKSKAIYFAVFVGIIAAGLQALFHWVKNGKPSKTHLITFFIFLLFGGTTLVLRDPVFIKWKPTLVNAILAAVFLGSTIIGGKSLMERMLGNSIQASRRIWCQLTIGWAAFFLFIAILNIIIAYKFSEPTWVNFKLFGILGLTFGFLAIQGVYLSRHLRIKNK